MELKLRKSDRYFILIALAVALLLFTWNIEFSRIYHKGYNMAIIFVDIPGPINIAYIKDFDYDRTIVKFASEKIVDESQILNDLGIITMDKFKHMNI